MTVGGNQDISQIESFSGGPDYEMFLDAVSSVGIHYGWTEAQMLRTIEMKLKDKAREYYGSLLPSERPRTMTAMKQWFRRVFGLKLTLNAGKRELERCIRTPGEPLGEYAQRLKVVANKMFPPSALTTPEKLYHRNLLLVNQFLGGLDRKLANEVLRVGEFYNLDDCLEVAEECEEIVSRMIPEPLYDIVRSLEVNTESDPNAGEERDRPENGGYGVSGRMRAGSGTRTGHRGARTYHPPPERYYPGRQQRNGHLEEGGDYAQRGARPNPEREHTRERHRQPTSRRFRTDRTEGQQGPVYARAGQPEMSTPNRDDGNAAPMRFDEKYPYMFQRCINCGQKGHRANGCLQPKRQFCYHCGEEGQHCYLNCQRPQLRNPM